MSRFVSAGFDRESGVYTFLFHDGSVQEVAKEVLDDFAKAWMFMAEGEKRSITIEKRDGQMVFHSEYLA